MRHALATAQKVFPTHVGVFLPAMCIPTGCACLPHARGGVSEDLRHYAHELQSSPRTWGCFLLGLGDANFAWVFPTHVGVFPPSGLFHRRSFGLPHARGGVSDFGIGHWNPLESSPRTWGCFLLHLVKCAPIPVFPTHVGVFPRVNLDELSAPGLPHARGGVSHRSGDLQAGSGSSPRTWGCFRRLAHGWPRHGVFPTHVGVFLHRAHLRATR